MNLRNITLGAASAIALATLAGAASAQAATPVTGTATANANIVSPHTVTSTQSLEFGSIVKPTTGSTVVTVASGNGTNPTFSNAGSFALTTNAARAAIFRLTGASGDTYSFGTSSLVFSTAAASPPTLVGAEAPVVVTGTSGVIPASGLQDVFVGGHLTVDQNTTVQAYTGTLSLTVNYN